MGGLHPKRDPDDPLHSMMAVLTEAGFTCVLGTNCEQTYDRYLRVGEEVTVTTRLESVVGPKRTGGGRGLLRHHPQRLARAHPDGRRSRSRRCCSGC